MTINHSPLSQILGFFNLFVRGNLLSTYDRLSSARSGNLSNLGNRLETHADDVLWFRRRSLLDTLFECVAKMIHENINLAFCRFYVFLSLARWLYFIDNVLYHIDQPDLLLESLLHVTILKSYFRKSVTFNLPPNNFSRKSLWNFSFFMIFS